MSEFWGAAQVISNHERRATKNLRDQSFEVISPFFMDHQLRGPPLARPFWPGYLLLRLDEQWRWGRINNTPGVIRLLATRAGVPYRLPDHEVDKVRRCLVPNPKGGEPLLSEGTVVKALRGPFVGYEAVVSWSVEQRLGLLFTIFNEECEIEFSSGDVAVVSSPR